MSKYCNFALGALAVMVLGGCAMPRPAQGYCGLTNQAGITVFKPEGLAPAERRPTIIFLHGIGSNWSSMSIDASHAVSKGFVAISANTHLSNIYQLMTPLAAQEGRYWEAAREVECLIRSLRAEPDTHHVDPNRIALAGYSMGGLIGYTVALPPTAIGDKLLPGETFLSSQHPDVSGKPNAFIAISTTADAYPFASGGAVAHSSFVTGLDSDNRALYASFANPGRVAPYGYGPALTLSGATEHWNAASRMRAAVQAGMDKRFAELTEEAVGDCAASNKPDSCTAIGGKWIKDVDGDGCSCLQSMLFSSIPSDDALEVVPGTSHYLSGAGRKGWERWIAASYMDTANRIPILILHGDKDELVHPASAGMNYDLLRSRGYPVKMVTFPGANHTWNASAAGPSPERTRRDDEIMTFLTRDLGWTGSSGVEACEPAPASDPEQLIATAERLVRAQSLSPADTEVVASEISALAQPPVTPVVTRCEASF